MKALIALLFLSSVSVAAPVKVTVCDASLVVGMGDQPIKTLSHNPGGAMVADNGISYTVVQGNNVLVSPEMREVNKGIWRAVDPAGVLFIKRGGSYQVTTDGSRWLYYDNCRAAGVTM